GDSDAPSVVGRLGAPLLGLAEELTAHVARLAHRLLLALRLSDAESASAVVILVAVVVSPSRQTAHGTGCPAHDGSEQRNVRPQAQPCSWWTSRSRPPASAVR